MLPKSLWVYVSVCVCVCVVCVWLPLLELLQRIKMRVFALSLCSFWLCCGYVSIGIPTVNSQLPIAAMGLARVRACLLAG